MLDILRFERNCSATHSASSVLSGRTLWSTIKPWGLGKRLFADCASVYRVASAIESTPPLIAKPIRRSITALHQVSIAPTKWRLALRRKIPSQHLLQRPLKLLPSNSQALLIAIPSPTHYTSPSSCRGTIPQSEDIASPHIGIEQRLQPH
jgi:hypothetical protein